MVFHKSRIESKSSQVSWTLLSILADLNNTVVWMVSTRPLISKSSSHFIIPMVTVQRAPITIGLNVTFIIIIIFINHSKYIYRIFYLYISTSAVV